MRRVCVWLRHVHPKPFPSWATIVAVLKKLSESVFLASVLVRVRFPRDRQLPAPCFVLESICAIGEEVGTLPVLFW